MLATVHTLDDATAARKSRVVIPRGALGIFEAGFRLRQATMACDEEWL
jgi:hypothetical protein